MAIFDYMLDFFQKFMLGVNDLWTFLITPINIVGFDTGIPLISLLSVSGLIAFIPFLFIWRSLI